MSLKKTRGRHRAATSSPSTKIRTFVAGHEIPGPRQVAVAMVGAGLLLGGTAPAHAGAISSVRTVDYAAAEVADAGSGLSHTVQSGDTLGQIAAEHGVELSSLLSLNGLSLESVIYPGDRIQIAAAAPASAPALQLMTSASATWSAGESSPAMPETNGAASTSSPMNQAILASARAQLGAIQDCTVLGEVALRAAGVSGVGDESPESLMAFATPVSNPQPGDFIYYADGGMGLSHNAVYIGNGQAIHSGWNGNQTVIESVDVGSGPVYYRVNS